MNKKRSTFGTKFGAVMAIAGSAVGLGNIWKFPYITGENGGGAFLVVYLVCIALIGIPLMLTEFALGRRGAKNAVGTFKKLAPGKKWHYFGALSVLAAFIILSYYGTIAGWTFKYIYIYFTNSFEGFETQQIVEAYHAFVSNPIEPIVCQLLFIMLTGLIIAAGVEKGIERYSKFLMPVLFILVVILGIRASTLDGAGAGLRFLFYPDFSKLTGESILIALGHSFFSLSIGMGILLTYSSYLGKKADLVRTSIQVGIADTTIAILAGVAIFPTVFAFNMEPNAGPGLIFLTLPKIFSQMSFGFFWGILFFVLISFAALTSTISLMEVIVAFVIEEWHIKRGKATILTIIALTVLGLFSTLSFGILGKYTLMGNTIFGVMDFISSNVLLPVGGLFICVFAGWIMKKEDMYDELTNNKTREFKLFKIYMFLIRYVVPVAIFLILLNGLGVI